MAPKKRFGQHFLQDPQYLQQIIACLRPERGQALVEIGPGPGALTFPVLQKAGKLIAVELDRDLVPALETRAAAIGELTVYQQDVLTFDFAALAEMLGQKLRVFGNLPYNISTPLLFHLFDAAAHIEDMHFMLQKEVAERLAAKTNTNGYGRLSVMCQYHCQVELLFTVPASAFSPPPKVESAVVQLIPHQTLLHPANNLEHLTRVVREAFGQRRKTLRNSLKALVSAEDWQALHIDSSLRAEALSLQEFVKIANYLDSTRLTP